jgi:hypothetical protein
MQVLIAMMVTAVVLLVVTKVWLRIDPVMMLPVRLDLAVLLWGAGLGVGIAIASAIIYQLWPSYRIAANLYLQLVLAPLVWVDLLWLGLLPGLSEELLFRGVMLSSLGLNTTALVLSSLCFGVLHMGSLRQWPYMLWASMVGGLLGYSALATHNLLVPIIAHVLTNWIAGISWKWMHRPPSSLEGTSGG